MKDRVISNIKKNDANERLSYIKEYSNRISQAIQDCINNCPFFKYADYSYIFSHKRSGDFPGDPDRVIWQNRLTKPKAQTNSMLFKVYKVAIDALHIKWIIPPREQWSCYQKGNLFENEIVINSIYDFEHNRQYLECKEPDDLEDDRIHEIYQDLSKTYRMEKQKNENKDESNYPIN